MKNLLLTGLSSLYLTVSYFGLLFPSVKKRGYISFFIYYIFLFTVLCPFIGQAVNLFIVSGACIIIYLSCNRSVLHIILSLTGYLISVLINHLFTIPLSFLGITLADIQTFYYVPFILSGTLVTAVILALINRFFISPRIFILQNCPPKLLRLFLADLFIGIGLLTVNIIYGEAQHYPPNVLTMNGILISLLSLSSILLFYSLYEVLLENQQLTLQQKEQAVISEYIEQMEKLYDEMRTFRHDYKNILCTMEDYITSRDIDNLDIFFHEKILPTSTFLPGQNLFIGRLSLIYVPPVKGLLCSKLIICQKQEIPFTLELSKPVENFYMDTLELCTILGILLDNAIEAALTSADAKLELSILPQHNSVRIGICNSSRPLKVPISRLFNKGYTDKEGHTGLGLNTIKKILTRHENVFFTIEYNETTFFVSLEICKEEL